MKKLLAILAVTGIIIGSSQTLISCGEDKEEKEKVKINLATANLAIEAFEAGGQVQYLIDKVHAKLADLAGAEINKETIANDQNLKITINNKIIDEFKNTNLVAGQTYKIKITANANDIYFTGIGKTSVTFKKIDLTQLTEIPNFNGTFGQKGIDLKNEVYKELADQSGLTEKQVKDDKNLKIIITDVSGNILWDDDPLTSKIYKITLTATPKDQYFTGKSGKIATEVRLKFDLAQVKTISNQLEGTDKTGKYLIDEIIKKLAGESGIEYLLIKNDPNLTITITDKDGKEIKEDTALTYQTYKITLTATPEDEYFTGTSGKILTEVTVKFDLATIAKIPNFYGINKTGDDLKNAVYKELVKKIPDPEIIWEDFKNDTNLTITIKKGETPVENNTALETGEYTITIAANENDQYFKGKSGKITVTITEKFDLGQVTTITDFDATGRKKGNDLKNAVYKELADASGLTEKQIKDDKNLTIIIKKDGSDITNESNLVAGEYTITISLLNLDDQYFTGTSSEITVKVTIFAKINLATADLTIEKLSVGDDYQLLIDMIRVKLVELTEHYVDLDTIKNDDNLTIKITDQDGKEVNENTVLIAGQTYKITISVNNNDIYFTGTKTTSVTIKKVNLEGSYFEIMPFEATGKTGKDLFNKVFDKLADLAKVDAETIKTDRNLTITIIDKDDNEIKEDTALSAGRYTITIKANDNDSYFTGTLDKITVTLTVIVNLQEVEIIIEQFNANGLRVGNLVDIVFDQLTELSGLSSSDLWDHSENVTNDFIIIKDESGKRLEINDHLTAQTYTIIITALDNDQYFTGISKEIKVIVN